jgi:glutamine synthetase
MIDAYIELKRAEAKRVSIAVHPLEYELYYSV